MTAQPMSMRIGELSRRVGVSTHVLRAWETRYALLRPVRSSGGYRLYGPGDVRRVNAVLELRAKGVSAAEAARTVLRAERLGGSEPLESGSRLTDDEIMEHLDEFVECVRSFDESSAQVVVDRLSQGLNLEDFIQRALMPALALVGDRWEQGSLTVAHEHFASNLLRHRLTSLALTWSVGVGPRVVLACPARERHDMPLLALGVLLGAKGWQVKYLGADTPLTDLANACRVVDPHVVILASTRRSALEAVAPGLRHLAQRQTVAIGGRGASAELADALGACLLPPSLVDSAELLNAQYRAASSTTG